MGRFGNRHLWKRCKLWAACAIFYWMLGIWTPAAQAGVLAERLARFPQWHSKPPVAVAQGDLGYPEWMAGRWEVTNTLEELSAPLAPKLVTPGFESNRRYLHQPVKFLVQFQPAQLKGGPSFPVLNPGAGGFVRNASNPPAIVADRAFNGFSIGKAYLGEQGVISVKVDPQNPNRQITVLPGSQQLISTITGRGTEKPEETVFIATEICQQVFQRGSQIYLNEVETTTRYQWLAALSKVEAEQITAIYLSPQDPDYFIAGDRPVALYRYQLTLLPAPI